MSDRTYFQMLVHHCPPEQIGTLSAAIVDHVDLTGYPGPADVPAALAEACWPVQFSQEEANCGLVDEIDTAALIAAAPEACWEMWEDPKYEWLGDWAAYHPATGLLRAECGADGNPVLNAFQARCLLETHFYHQTAADEIMAVLYPVERFRRLITSRVMDSSEVPHQP